MRNGSFLYATETRIHSKKGYYEKINQHASMWPQKVSCVRKRDFTSWTGSEDELRRLAVTMLRPRPLMLLRLLEMSLLTPRVHLEVSE